MMNRTKMEKDRVRNSKNMTNLKCYVLGTSHKSAIEAYLNKADSTMAHCRNQLPSPSLESGAFHFVNASAPDNAVKGLCTCTSSILLLSVYLFKRNQK